MLAHNDPWLSEILERPVFKIDVSNADRGDVPTPASFAYAKIDVDQIKLAQSLSKAGYFIIDTNVTFRWVGNADEHDMHVLEASPEDETSVREIAFSAFASTRFHLDPNIDNMVANRIKEKWAGNFFAGKRGDLMLVYKESGRVLGFNQVILTENKAVIDLIAVRSDARGRGIGRAMVSGLQTRFKSIAVGTQINNIASIGLYTSLGFEFSNASYVFHYHKGV